MAEMTLSCHAASMVSQEGMIREGEEAEGYECQYYMTYPEIQTLYTGLVYPVSLDMEDEEDIEHPVIEFWSSLLRLPAFFRQPSPADPPGTGIWYLYETPPLQEILQDERPSEWSLLTVSRYGRGKQTGRTTKLVCIGRILGHAPESIDVVWSDGMSKLERFLAIVEAQPEQQDEPVYGIVAIGHEVRFFEAKNASTRPRSISPNGKTCHLAGDEESVHTILSTWAKNCRQ